MIKKMMHFWLILIFCLPSVVFAMELQWSSSPNDQSLLFLGNLFGPVGSAIPYASGYPLMGQIFSIFNVGVLTIGSIVVMYTVFVSGIAV